MGKLNKMSVFAQIMKNKYKIFLGKSVILNSRQSVYRFAYNQTR